MSELLPSSRVAVIGPGRVGTLLGIALARAGHRVVAVAGGRDASRTEFCRLIAGVRDREPAEAAADADLVLLTTPDDVIEEVVTDLARRDAVREGQRIVHTAGTRGLAPLRRAALAGASVAACHPAQAVPSGTTDPDHLVGAAWAVTAPVRDLPWARDFVVQLGGDPHEVADDDRVLYHAGLVLGSNAVAASVALARQLLLASRIEDPGAFLAPLVHRSVDNVLASGAQAVTGPVVRGDVGTVRRHLEHLDADLPEVAAGYRRLTRVILDVVRPALDDRTVRALLQALSEGVPDEPEDG